MSAPLSEATPAFLAGRGMMRARIRDTDWARTPLGPIERWPEALRGAIATILDTPVPTVIYWGPELIALYNDAFHGLLAGLPDLLGRRFSDLWEEAQGATRPLAERALAGEAIYLRDQCVTLMRGGQPEAAWFDFSFSPLRRETGEVAGIVHHWIEMTDRVRLRRRRAFLLSLGDALAKETEPRAILAAATRVLGEHLRASRVHYAELQDDGGVRIHDDYRDGVESIAGLRPCADFSPRLLATLRAGQTLVHEDLAKVTELEDRTRRAFAALHVAAVAAVPLVRGGRLAAFLSVHQSVPRRWRGEEVALIEETARRTWEALERARAEEALRRSEARYRTLFHSIDQGFCVIEVLFDAQGRPVDYRFLEVNRVFEEHTGLKDPVGRTARELIPHLDAHWFHTYGRVALSGEPVRLQGEVPALGRWFDVFAFRVEAPEQRQVAVLFKDITSSRAAQEALQRSEARLQQALASMKEADRRKDEFLATLAHELRNPLAPLSTGLELLRRSGGAPQPRVHEMMARQVTHLRRLVDDLIEVSRITRGKVELRRERVELARVLDSALETTAAQLKAAGHTLEVKLPREPLVLDADPVRLAQVFANLLDNAVKYTPAGGQIALEAVREGDEVRVSVQDTGMGIAADMLPRVFDMFVQASPEQGRGRAGLGIGLTLARSLVELHGGTVEARSDGIGKGTEMRVRLPLLDQAVEPAGQPPRRTGGLGPDLRVLVVDDNRDAADSLADLLVLLGTSVRVAYDGRRALEVAREQAPQVVLLDLGMPELDGFEVARRMRATPWGRDVLLAALTGWGQDEDRRRSREAGFDHHLVKPVDVAALESLLAQVGARGR